MMRQCARSDELGIFQALVRASFGLRWLRNE
jgi:hypothetical protein